jgi:site-specific recombinase XerD
MNHEGLEEKDVNAIFNTIDELIENARTANEATLNPLLRDRIILRLTYLAGLRVSEILAIDIDAWSEPSNREDGNYTAATIDIQRSRRILKIKISDSLLIEMLREYIRDSRPQLLIEAIPGETAMFLSLHGRRLTISAILHRMNRVLERAGLGGLGITIHRLRYAGVMAKIVNIDEENGAHLRGYSSTGTIDRFLDLLPLDSIDN